MGQTFKLVLFLSMVSVSASFSCANADKPEIKAEKGERTFKNQCSICHGFSGNKQLSGAKKLTESMLPIDEIEALVTHGKKQMPPFKNRLTAQEIKLVSEYAFKFRASK